MLAKGFTEEQVANETGMIQDLEAEQAILGLLCQTGTDWGRKFGAERAAAAIFEQLEPGDFWREYHRELYAAMREIFTDTGFVNRVTLAGVLRRSHGTEWLAPDVVMCYLDVMTRESMFDSRNWQKVVKSLRDATARRRARVILEGAFNALGQPGEDDADAILLRTQRELGDIRPANVDSVRPLGRYIGDELMPRVFERKDEPGGPDTQWPTFDAEFLTGGFRPGRMTILQAPRKTGKSMIASQVAALAAIQGYSVGIASLEMAQSEVALRMICQLSGTSYTRAELGHLHHWEVAPFKETAWAFRDLRLYVTDERQRDVFALMQWFRRIKAEFGLDLAVVDYLQLLSPHIAREGMERNVSDSSRRLLVLSQELGCHVLLLSQLNKEGFAKWSGQSNDDAHFNWSVRSCDEHGTLSEEGSHLLFTVSQRFGKSGVVPRLYLRTGETGHVEETKIGVGKLPKEHEAYADYGN